MIDQSLLKTCERALADILRRIGTDRFDEKGPHRFMDMIGITRKYRALSVLDAADTLVALSRSRKSGGRGKRLAAAILVGMEDIDPLFRRLGILDIYNQRSSGPVSQYKPWDYV